MNEIRCKRIYEPSADSDGFRILVDRLWPRGIKKKMPKLIYGQRKSPPQVNCENGFLTNLQDSMRLKSNTCKSLTTTPRRRNLETCADKKSGIIT